MNSKDEEIRLLDKFIHIRPYLTFKRSPANNPDGINEELAPNQDINLKRSDTIAFLVLGCLTFIQSMPLGIFGASIPMILIAKGVSFLQLAILALMGLPYIFKIFLAPIFDSVLHKIYWCLNILIKAKHNKYGKRKSFLVPAQILGGIILISGSFWIESVVENQRIFIITLTGFLIILICAAQDVIVDGWVVSLVSKRNFAHMTTMQRIVSTLGFFISFNAFIPLNSVEFCNTYIFSEPKDTPLLTLSGFVLGTGVFFVVSTLLLHFFQENTIPEEHIPTTKEIIGALRLFWEQPKLRILALTALTGGFNAYPVLAIFVPSIIKQGIEKETVANIFTAVIPVGFVAALLTVTLLIKFDMKNLKGYVNKRYRKELKVFAVGYILNIFYIFIPIGTSIYVNVQAQFKETVIILIVLTALVTTTYIVKFSSWKTYCFRIAHESTASTFMVVLLSLTTLGGYWPSVIALLLGDYISVTVIGIICVVYSIFYQIFLWKKVVPLENDDHTHFDFYKDASKDAIY